VKDAAVTLTGMSKRGKFANQLIYIKGDRGKNRHNWVKGGGEAIRGVEGKIWCKLGITKNRVLIGVKEKLIHQGNLPRKGGGQWRVPRGKCV